MSFFSTLSGDNLQLRRNKWYQNGSQSTRQVYEQIGQTFGADKGKGFELANRFFEMQAIQIHSTTTPTAKLPIRPSVIWRPLVLMPRRSTATGSKTIPIGSSICITAEHPTRPALPGRKHQTRKRPPMRSGSCGRARMPQSRRKTNGSPCKRSLDTGRTGRT